MLWSAAAHKFAISREYSFWDLQCFFPYDGLFATLDTRGKRTYSRKDTAVKLLLNCTFDINLNNQVEQILIPSRDDSTPLGICEIRTDGYLLKLLLNHLFRAMVRRWTLIYYYYCVYISSSCVNFLILYILPISSAGDKI